ncbi:MAG: serine/threonine-protein kinase [Steroidobacter sp.]
MNTIHPPSPRWQLIQDLFTRASDLPPGERDIFLSAECGTDEVLRQEVNDLLMMDSPPQTQSSHPSLPSPLTHAVNRAIEKTVRDRRGELLGSVVGAYRLTEILGHGGAGTVYLGERADRQYSARVAVKVVANGLFNEDVQRRFQSERQILANLNHPNISRLLDAGETRQGQPFLVMEYVHGEVIDKYCDNQKLGINQRLELFVKVCEAVQYAHRNLIVHRDLKPGNILVTPDGTPKLLDFGIAKLLDENAIAALRSGNSAYTRINDRVLTPEYASPEQILGQTVTTTSDVYTLGIVLYELMAGVRPYQVSTVSQLELERSICVIDPLKPSQMMARMSANKPLPLVGALPKNDDQDVVKPAPHANAIAYARGLSEKRLQHRLTGDIDAIIMRALRKEPERRYSSVEQLIEDIQRYLNQEPVLARQGNWAYYSRRFVRRHALGVTMSSIALIALTGFAVVMSIQAKRIAEQRDRATQENAIAESVSNFMQEVFTASDPYQSLDKQVTAKELLDKAAERISGDLSQQPEVRARLLEAIGIAYGNQGQLDYAIKYLSDALTLQRTLEPQNKNRLALILDRLGHAYFEKDNFNDALNALSESRKILENNNQVKSSEYLQVLTDSGLLEHRLSHLDKAKYYYETGLNLSKNLYGNYHPETASLLMQLAEVATWQSKYDDAERLSREAVNIYHSTLPEKHPDRIAADISLGQLLYRKGQIEQASSLIRNGLLAQKSVFGKDSLRLLNTYDILYQIQMHQLKWDESESSVRTELAIAEKNLGKTSFDTGVTHSSVADVLLRRGNFVAAEKEARESLKILRATTSPDHQYVASAEYLLASALVGEHKANEAEPMLRENMARWNHAQAPAWRAARSESLLGAALIQLHKGKEAGVALNHAYEVLSAKDSGADADVIATAKKRVEEYQRCVAGHHENNCQLSE